MQCTLDVDDLMMMLWNLNNIKERTMLFRRVSVGTAPQCCCLLKLLHLGLFLVHRLSSKLVVSQHFPHTEQFGEPFDETICL